MSWRQLLEGAMASQVRRNHRYKIEIPLMRWLVKTIVHYFNTSLVGGFDNPPILLARWVG
jgi:hypothetical protein